MMESNFRGKIGISYMDSEPDWLSLPSSDGAPNVLVILLDDTGFGNLGCYGSTIETPNMDALAANGLRYNNFHVTPLCSPTRASLLTGRNHHAVGMATIVDGGDAGFPNRRSRVSRHAATLAEMLSEEGFATFTLGKWHLNPSTQNSAGGSREEWPLQRGFDRFYGFLPGATDQFYPELTYDNHPVSPSKTPEEGYHLTEDLVDHAIEFVNDLKAMRPETPFFMYFAPGAMHNPHQAPKEYIDKYKGRFDEGWDVIRERYFQKQTELGIIPDGTRLPPRNPGVQAWETLSQNEKNFVCRLQETWAGFLEHTDAQIGRLIEHLRAINQLDNTLLILTADNGTSQNGGPYGVMNIGPSPLRNAANNGQTVGGKTGRALPEEDFDAVQEKLDDIGSPHSYTDIPWGWAQVGNTPLPWYKQDTHAGGVRVPMIIHYPPAIKDAGGVRGQFHFVSDLTPTILEVLNLQPRSCYRGYDQMPITGTSMAYTFDDRDCPTQKPVQYFEMMGNRALWLDGWMAVTRHDPDDDYNDDEWELYYLDEDFSQSNNLAEAEPDQLKKLIERWWVEAGRYGVLPLRSGLPPRPATAEPDSLTYHFVPPMARIASKQSPVLEQGNWSLTAEVEILSETEGVIYAQGKSLDGFSLFIQNSTLCFVYNALGQTISGRSTTTLPNGRITVGAAFKSADDGTGTITLTGDGETIGSIQIPDATRRSKMRGVEIGRNRHSPIADVSPFEFTGVIHFVDICVELR